MLNISKFVVSVVGTAFKPKLEVCYNLAMNLFLLRWGFDFYNDKPSVRGRWSAGAEGEASNVNKEWLRRAYIEGKNIETREIVTMVECDGHDFVHFQWVMLARFNNLSRLVRHQFAGLKMLTRERSYTVLPSGNVSIVTLSENEKQNNTFAWMRV